MAFRGAGRDLDPEERQWLQEYEDLVDQDYDPFHVKCGRDVFLSDKKLIAIRTSGYSFGVVFSAKPIPLGGTFHIKLLEKGVELSGWAGPLVSAQTVPYTVRIVRLADNFEQSVIPNISIFYSVQSIMSRPKNAVSHLVCKDQEYR